MARKLRKIQSGGLSHSRWRIAELAGTLSDPLPGQNSQTKWFPASITASGLQMYLDRCFCGWSFCLLRTERGREREPNSYAFIFRLINLRDEPSSLLLCYKRSSQGRIWRVLIVDRLIVRKLQVEKRVLKRVSSGVLVVDALWKPSGRENMTVFGSDENVKRITSQPRRVESPFGQTKSFLNWKTNRTLEDSFTWLNSWLN